MSIIRYVIYFVLWLLSFSGLSTRICQHISKKEGPSGKFKIVGLFPFRDDISTNGILASIAFTYTMEKVIDMFNEPNLIQYVIYDTCSYSDKTDMTSSVLDILLDKQNSTIDWRHSQHLQQLCQCANYSTSDLVIGAVGPPFSSSAKYISSLLSVFNIPVVSYTATSVELSNKERYPNFFRTILPDNYQAKLIKDILLHYDWTYVSVIASDESYGRVGQDELLNQFKLHNICVAIGAIIGFPESESNIINTIKKLKNDEHSNVIILWALKDRVKVFLNYASQEKLYNKTWIVSEAISTDRWFLQFDQLVVTKMIIIGTDSGRNEDFNRHGWNLNFNDSFSNPWLKRFFQRHNVSQHSNQTLANFKDYFDYSIVGFVQNAVLSLLHAFKSYLIDHQVCDELFNCTYPNTINHTVFISKYLQKVKFKGVNNESIFFDNNGDITFGTFKLYTINYVNGKSSFKQFAKWSSNKNNINVLTNQTNINKETIKSQCSGICKPGHYKKVHKHKRCCWDCLPCATGFYQSSSGQELCKKCPYMAIPNLHKTECIQLTQSYIHKDSYSAIAIYLLTSVGIVLCCITMRAFIRYKETPIVRSSNFRLSFMQLAAHIILYMSLPLFVLKDTEVVCTVRIFSSIVCMATILSVTFVKTSFILKIFCNTVHQTQQEVRYMKTSAYTAVAVLSISPALIQVVLLQWKPIKTTVNINPSAAEIEETCETEVHYGFQVIYYIVLQLLCGVQAFRARNLPSNYHEALYISFAMFSSAIVLILTIPIVGSMADAKSKYTALSMMLLLAIL